MLQKTWKEIISCTSFPMKRVLFVVVCIAVASLFVMLHEPMMSSGSLVWTPTSPQVLERMRSMEDSQRKTSSFLNYLFCQMTQVLPSGGFCLNENKIYSGGNNVWDARLCRKLEELFGSASVGDFGAGLGQYGRCFLRHYPNFVRSNNPDEQRDMRESFIRLMAEAKLNGTPQVVRSWKGWDGALNIDTLSDGKIAVLDLSAPVDLGEQFDWVLSLEVGEHIAKKGEQIFIDNLVKHACKGVVLSWAVPNQGGHYHVNTQSNEYIQAQMEKRGMVRDIATEQDLRNVVTVGWFKNTLMVYRFPKQKC